MPEPVSTSVKKPKQLQLVVCPQELEVSGLSIFVGGGISNCPDWQSELLSDLSQQKLTAFNPRRPDFPIHDPSASYQQIRWEHQYLKSAKGILFWFPKETVCPITLYELGTYLRKDIPLFVGVHPEYERDVEILKLAAQHRPNLKIVRSLSDLSQQVKSWSDGVAIESTPLRLPPIINNKIFLAGGIKGCSDWQSPTASELESSNILVHNPRRSDFKIENEETYSQDLEENHRAFLESKEIAFWFPKESINPIVLMELGIASNTDKKLFVGVDPEYFRRADVEIQTSLVRPEVEIVYSLNDLTSQIKSWHTVA